VVSAPVIELAGLSFAYPERPPVLAGLDWRLEAGQRVGILGSNGAGKSTLFMLAMGLLPPDAGEVRLFGRACRREKDFRGLRTRLGFCFQDPDDQLFSATVAEDVAFGPLNQGKGRRRALELVEESLAALGLEGFGQRVTYHLSGGEKRLVSLATALALEPETLLLDEPTAGLDPETTSRLERVLAASGLGWAMISHDRAFLERTCGRLLRLAGGRLAPA
jgi:cobalt/nickel transport system ATP-binding protein